MAISDDCRTRSTRATPTTRFAWDFARLYARSAGHVQRRARARTGLQARPRPRRRPGQPSDGGKTWTYKLRGRQVRGRHRRSRPRTSSTPSSARLRHGGPARRPDVLQRVPRPAGTTRAPTRTRTKRPEGHRDPGRPDIVFHLKKPFADFDYLADAARRPAPVPQAKDTGDEVQVSTSISSGPYKFKTLRAGQGVRRWSATRTGTPATDPIRKALPDKIDAAS